MEITEIVSGEILFNNRDLSKINEKEFQKLRGNEISMIFQEPMTSLNPVFTIGEQLSEPLKQHKKMSKSETRETIVKVLKQVGLPRAEQIIDEYPHQLSGGMMQRVMISLALLCQPKLMIADEPVSALDVSVQSQVINLLLDLQKEFSLTYLFISHDLGVIRHMTDRVACYVSGENRGNC
jgi:peptide/nickel transport system ATP-binding protein